MKVEASRYEFFHMLRERMKYMAERLEYFVDADLTDQYLESLDTFRKMVLELAPEGYMPPNPAPPVIRNPVGE